MIIETDLTTKYVVQVYLGVWGAEPVDRPGNEFANLREAKRHYAERVLRSPKERWRIVKREILTTLVTLKTNT